MAEDEARPLIEASEEKSDNPEDEKNITGYDRTNKENIENEESGCGSFLCSYLWPFIAVLIGIGVYIGYAQCEKSLAIQYYYYYKAKVDVDWAIYSKTETGSSSKTFTYNVWEAIRLLWKDESYTLALFVAGWSGLWPYLKLVIMAISLVVYRKVRMPTRMTWLSYIAHFSFLDLWMVMISGIAARFYYDGSETKTETDFFKISVTLTVKVWLQGYAQHGAYSFFYALVLSQLCCFFMIKFAQCNISDFVPRNNGNISEHFKSELFRPVCLGWKMAKRVPIPTRRKEDTSESFQLMWSILIYSCGLASLVASFFLLFHALYVDFMKVYWDFQLDETIDESDYGITYDKTFKLSEVTTKRYNMHSGLKELLQTTKGLGASNAKLCYIGIFMGIYLPLIRSVLVGALWILPMSKIVHRVVSFCTELVSLFAGHDTALIAFIIMGPLKQLENIFTHAESSLSDYITFDFDGIRNGVVWLIVVVVLENIFWYSVTSLHDVFILNSTDEISQDGENYEEAKSTGVIEEAETNTTNV